MWSSWNFDQLQRGTFKDGETGLSLGLTGVLLCAGPEGS